MKLINVYHRTEIRPTAAKFLYDLMKERDPEINISHEKMPSWAEHLHFIQSRPFRAWYLIEIGDTWVGYVSLTQNNEIGVVIKKDHRGKGYGPEAIQTIMRLYDPLPAQSAFRNGHWLANISPENNHSRHIFEKLGFVKLQETYVWKS